MITREEVIKILEEEKEGLKVDPKIPILSQMDSLDLLAAVMTIEVTYDIDIPTSAIYSLKFIEDLVGYINEVKTDGNL